MREKILKQKNYENTFKISADSDVRDYPKPIGTPQTPPKDPVNPTGNTPTGEAPTNPGQTGNTNVIVDTLTNDGTMPRTGFGNSGQIVPERPPRGTAEP